MHYPKIYLCIDNCFASKRWTRPVDWAAIIKELGIHFVEASADTELDPLYMGKSYLDKWIRDVKAAEKKIGIKVVNLYSGHGSYMTLGLTHTSAAVRRRMKEQWLKPIINVASEMGAGIGFFAHAFPDYALQNKKIYKDFKNILFENLIEVNNYSAKIGCGKIGLEQMYTPHHYPWRLKDLYELLFTVTSKSSRGFYFTEDAGHHHTMYAKPENLYEKIENYLTTGNIDGLWLGNNQTYDLIRILKSNNCSPKIMKMIKHNIDTNSHLFSEPADSNCYEWLRQFAAYSPIIHLQQTNGTTSAHWPFTSSYNCRGIIEPLNIFKAIKYCYDRPIDKRMPERVSDIYMTLEIFTATASINYETLKNLKESVHYWRTYITQDGMSLDEIIKEGKNKNGQITKKI
ncbi:MAG: hypothetical protein A2096_02185 [Spirochaetes bacterium GWF1_41_5]|nr:MAG: hypothetical protein A2096_02185 [Spirochaetes bacterium GWF1_41_5]HBE02238.1 hypothetical protein [Spirochaetia bacterium]